MRPQSRQMYLMRALWWLRRDLRINDHHGLLEAARLGLEIAAVAVEPTNKVAFAKKFWWDGIKDLRKELAPLGIELKVVQGPEAFAIAKWASHNQVDQVFAAQEYNYRDQKIENDLKTALGGISLHLFEGRSLLHPGDLPFPQEEVPLVYSNFRDQVLKTLKIPRLTNFRKESLCGFPLKEPAEIPALKDPPLDQVRLPYDFQGGAKAGQSRMKEFFWDSQAIKNYKETRNGMLEKNDSSKFSPWLAQGSLSPREIYWQLKAWEESEGPNESTVWFLYELLWRDYFKFLALRIGPQLFKLEGISKSAQNWSKDTLIFESWSQGQTGKDFVDSNMLELAETGWMSNRGRQNVASFLAKTLGIDWTWGAEWFEKHLIDDDPENNWGNWLYLAGVGTDPRNRAFNVDLQAQKYDAQGLYRNRWLKLRDPV